MSKDEKLCHRQESRMKQASKKRTLLLAEADEMETFRRAHSFIFERP